MRSLLALALASLNSIAAIAQTQASAPVLELTEGATTLAPRTYSLSAIHLQGFRAETDPVTRLTLGLTWNVRGHALSLVQPSVKLYRVADDDPEFLLADTELRFTPQLDVDWAGWKPLASTTVSLPVSEASQRNSVVTKADLLLGVTRKFLGDTLTYTAATGLRYFVNEYQTTDTSRGSGGGRALPLTRWSLTQSLAYQVNDKLSLTADGSYQITRFEDADMRNVGSTLQSEDGYPVDGYSYSVSANYQWNEGIVTSLGYAQEEEFARTLETRRFYVYDEYATVWYAALSYTLGSGTAKAH